MSHSVVDDSEVVFDHQEEKAGFLEKEGSIRNQSDQEPWLANTEPYRGARQRIRNFDRLVEKESEDGGDVPTLMLEETVGRLQRDLEELQSGKSVFENPKDSQTCTLSAAGDAYNDESALV